MLLTPFYARRQAALRKRGIARRQAALRKRGIAPSLPTGRRQADEVLHG